MKMRWLLWWKEKNRNVVVAVVAVEGKQRNVVVVKGKQ